MRYYASFLNFKIGTSRKVLKVEMLKNEKEV